MVSIPIHAETLSAIAVEKVTANKGETVAVPIKITDNTGICGATLTIKYDEKLTLESIEKGSALSSLAMTKPGDMSANPFNIVWDGIEEDNSNGIMANLNFTVPDMTGTYNVEITYEYGDIVNGALFPIDVATQDGYIKVGTSEEPDNPEQNKDFTVSIDSINANSGGDIDIPISIAENPGICGATISVSYDERLTIKKISKGNALSSLTMTKSGALTSNPINIVWDGTEADSSNGIIAILTFNVPNENDTYDVSLSFNDGDIVDGNLSPISPLLKGGYIKICSAFEAKVNVDGQSATLTGENQNGKIIAAFYDENNTLLKFKVYDVASEVDVDSVKDAEKVKIMWWDGLISMKPISTSKVLDLS